MITDLADPRSKLLRFGPVLSFGVGILLLSWFGRIIQNLLREHFRLEGLLLLVLIASIIFALLAGRIFEIRSKLSSMTLLTFPIGVILLRHNPEEGIHLMEYGTFALAVEWAQSWKISDERRIAMGILCGGFLGLTDEALQALNPVRYFDLRDIIFNFLGVAAATVAFRVRVDRYVKEHYQDETPSERTEST